MDYLHYGLHQHLHGFAQQTGLRPAAAFYRTMAGIPNAFATPQVLPGWGAGNGGTIGFAVDMVQLIISKYGQSGEWAMFTVLAHEYGHILQFHFTDTMSRDYGKLPEIQADIFAGFCLAHLANNPILRPQAQQGAFVVSDFLGMIAGGQTHGSAQERREAAHAGYQMARSMGPNLRAAIDHSWDMAAQICRSNCGD